MLVRGEGGSQAVNDALRLGRLLASCSHPADVPMVLSEYKKEMLPRGRVAVRRSRAVGSSGMENEGGVEERVAWGQHVMVGDVPEQ